jgi:guanylate kinase
MTDTNRGRLIMISGPSGAGKTTLVRKLFERCPGLKRSVSATTRSARRGEQDGIDYHFLTEEEFARRRAAGDFLECFQVFGQGHWYGTLASEVTPSLAESKAIVLEIDVQGAMAVLERYPQAVTIFVRPSSAEELERRLRGRASETEESIRRRLEAARHELASAGRYRFEVVNDDIDRAVETICDIIRKSEV